jgi:phenylalanyl-tRNA synthetase alpha chain
MVNLRENEVKTLLTLKKVGGRLAVKKIVKESGLAHAAVMRAALSLETKNLIKIFERKQIIVLLREEGKRYAEQGLPEKRLINELLKLGGEATVNKILESSNIENSMANIALGWLIRKGWAKIEKESQILKLLSEPSEDKDEVLINLLDKKGPTSIESINKKLKSSISTLKRRKVVEIRNDILRELELTKEGWKLIKKGILLTEEISQLTPDMIATNRWREVKIRKYNIKAAVAHTWPGKKHPYLRFLDELKKKLVALGFKEMTGPSIELSFFNCDMLYMPQDHPAREIHDMCFIKEPKYGNVDLYKQLLDNVKSTHENGWKTGSKGWGYSFSKLEAAHLVLRSHTTAVSARKLISEDLEIPGKYFAVARCFRPDVIDRTHLPEFNQIEGIILSEELTLKELLGTLERFAIEIGEADKVKYSPDYYPFTEPSVELLAYKKGLGWMEFGGSGIFRPEVTLPLGIKVPVLAWGLGVDRLFMMKTGIDDIRNLFSKDLDWIRHMRMT